jgi:hypothetical protein
MLMAELFPAATQTARVGPLRLGLQSLDEKLNVGQTIPPLVPKKTPNPESGRAS